VVGFFDVLDGWVGGRAGRGRWGVAHSAWSNPVLYVWTAISRCNLVGPLRESKGIARARLEGETNNIPRRSGAACKNRLRKKD